MDRKTEAVLTSALDLPDSERAEIAGALLESLEGPRDPDAELAWREEVARRVAAFDGGTGTTVPWEQVRDELLASVSERRAG
jgi:putative addiction module component (TIGR02574 family)